MCTFHTYATCLDQMIQAQFCIEHQNIIINYSNYSFYGYFHKKHKIQKKLKKSKIPKKLQNTKHKKKIFFFCIANYISIHLLFVYFFIAQDHFCFYLCYFYFTYHLSWSCPHFLLLPDPTHFFLIICIFTYRNIIISFSFRLSSLFFPSNNLNH